jgi:hypothetical protein
MLVSCSFHGTMIGRGRERVHVGIEAVAFSRATSASASVFVPTMSTSTVQKSEGDM